MVYANLKAISVVCRGAPLNKVVREVTGRRVIRRRCKLLEKLLHRRGNKCLRDLVARHAGLRLQLLRVHRQRIPRCVAAERIADKSAARRARRLRVEQIVPAYNCGVREISGNFGSSGNVRQTLAWLAEAPAVVSAGDKCLVLDDRPGQHRPKLVLTKRSGPRLLSVLESISRV